MGPKLLNWKTGLGLMKMEGLNPIGVPFLTYCHLNDFLQKIRMFKIVNNRAEISIA